MIYYINDNERKIVTFSEKYKISDVARLLKDVNIFMKLNYETVKKITCGAVRITEDDGFRFYRFTEEQEENYRKYRSWFVEKTFSTPGVCLNFNTNSRNLYINVDIRPSTTRSCFAFDIFCDGKMIDCICNFNENDIPSEQEGALGEHSKNISLGEGDKTVKIVFPWSVASVIKEISLDDDAYVMSAKKDKKIIMYGDSITHGYDALHPSNTYAYRFSEMINAEMYNKAIGGEVFAPEVSEHADKFTPDYITVAYGTNDWNANTEYNAFKGHSRKFFDNLTRNYPNTPIFAITPIWRKEANEQRKMGSFDNVKKQIFDIAADYDNIIPVCGYDFVPKSEEYFSDKHLHPNDYGFSYYAKSLYDAVREKY